MGWDRFFRGLFDAEKQQDKEHLLMLLALMNLAKVKAFWQHLPSITSRCGYMESQQKSGRYLRYPNTFVPNKFVNLVKSYPFLADNVDPIVTISMLSTRVTRPFPTKIMPIPKLGANSQVCARRNLSAFSGQHKGW